MGTESCSQPTDYQSLKMGVYDGVYQLDMSQADPNWAALHKEMGIPEADTKAMISGGNVHTMTVMENKDGSSLKARAVFWKVSPKEDCYYEMETEKGMFPVLQQLMPQMTEDAWKELIKNGGVTMKLKVDKTK